MKKNRFKKLLMASGVPRNTVNQLADLAKEYKIPYVKLIDLVRMELIHKAVRQICVGRFLND